MKFISGGLDPQHLLRAAQRIGESETGGANKSPVLAKMWAAFNFLGLLGEPWCGLFAADIMRDGGYPYPVLFYRAKAWASWGVPCPQSAAKLGCIAVLSRKGGGHVAFVAGKTADGKIVLLGGNQRDSVCLMAVDASEVVAYRTHPAWPLVPLTLYPNEAKVAGAQAAEQFA